MKVFGRGGMGAWGKGGEGFLQKALSSLPPHFNPSSPTPKRAGPPPWTREQASTQAPQLVHSSGEAERGFRGSRPSEQAWRQAGSPLQVQRDSVRRRRGATGRRAISASRTDCGQTQRHQSRSPVTSSTASTVITGRNGTAKKRRCSRTVWIVLEESGAAAVRKPRDRPPGRESWLSSGKPSRGTSASPTSAITARDRNPCLSGFGGRLPRMACTSSDKNPKGQNHEQKMRPRHRATASTTSAPAIKRQPGMMPESPI